MPTLDEWEAALIMQKRIRVISDNSLVQAVNRRPSSKSYSGQRKNATVAPEVGLPRYHQIMPLELLGSMGLISTPRIDNLVDLCSTWAKYATYGHLIQKRLFPIIFQIN